MHPTELFAAVDLDIRLSQLNMINHIKEAIQNDENLVVEAGTGVGKTFAYVLGAYLGIKEKEKQKKIKHIIISTNTITLQSQLIKKDLPIIKKMIGEKITYNIAKGRGRYICHLRLYNKLEHNPEFKDLADALDDDWLGDMDELKIQVKSSDWLEVNNTANTCIGNRCEFYSECAYVSARDALRKSDIIVTNHSLLLAHLSLGDAAILPKYSDSLFIIDECHHLPGKSISTFSHNASVIGAQGWINDIDKNINGLQKGIVTDREKSELTEIRKNLIIELSQAQKYIDEIYEYYGRDADIYRITSVSEGFLENAGNIKNQALSCSKIINRIKLSLESYIEDQGLEVTGTIEQQLSSLKFYLDRCESLYNVWREFQNDHQPPFAKWFSKKNTNAQSDLKSHLQDYSVCVAPITANKILKQALWDNVENSVILCSATIKALGNFSQFLNESGLDEKTKCVELPSPFHYEKSEVILPEMKSFPQNYQLHTKESADIIKQCLNKTKKGILVLFCSMQAMKDVFALLPKKQQDYIIMQGEKPKSEILFLHKKMIDRDLPSVIFGVDSFSEGVDLPGKYLELLIIHKIPFAVPTDPVEQTRSDWIQSQGQNPFMNFSLPIASIKLTQMTGRLIRTEQDVGKVIILDKRIVAKDYGKGLIEGLPDFKIRKNVSIERV